MSSSNCALSLQSKEEEVFVIDRKKVTVNVNTPEDLKVAELAGYCGLYCGACAMYTGEVKSKSVRSGVLKENVDKSHQKDREI